MPEGDLTQWLRRLRDGDDDALDRLLPLVYEELRVLARAHMRREAEGHTLGATALVHETYLRLAGRNEIAAGDRAHFYAIAAQAMRRALIDHARGRRAQKRGSGQVAATLSHARELLQDDGTGDLLAIDEALTRLAEASPRAAQVVERLFFAGLTLDQTAESLGVSKKTVQRDWTPARAWLQKELETSDEEPDAPPAG